jgi:hypothetical protein
MVAVMQNKLQYDANQNLAAKSNGKLVKCSEQPNSFVSFFAWH